MRTKQRIRYRMHGGKPQREVHASIVVACRGMRFAVLALLIGSAIGCGSGAEAPIKVKREDPGAHVRRIASVWRETLEDEGLPDGDPELSFFRIRRSLRVELTDGGGARETIERTELFKMRDGFEYHCITKGSIEGHARYQSVGGEIHVALSNELTRLPRDCREGGFKKKWKDVPAGTTTFALRSDRLIAIDPPLARSVLLPAQ